jgi:hypothetical protein
VDQRTVLVGRIDAMFEAPVIEWRNQPNDALLEVNRRLQGAPNLRRALLIFRARLAARRNYVSCCGTFDRT